MPESTGRAPQHIELSGRSLFEVEICRARLVGERSERREPGRDEDERAKATQHERRHCTPSPDDVGISLRRGVAAMRAAVCASGGAGTSTVYLRTHVFVRLIPGGGFLLGEPRRSSRRFRSPRRAGMRPGTTRVDEYEMPAVSGFDGPLPRAGRKLRNGKREARPELLAEKFGRAVAVIVLEHERISE